MKVTPGWLKDKIMRIIERESRIVFRSDVLHVSEVSHCLRKSFYNRKNVVKFTEEQALKILMGASIHEKLQKMLMEEGWKAEYEVSYNFKRFSLYGHVDLFNPRENIVLELKTVSKLPEEVFIEHERQVNAYLAMLRIENGYIAYISRNGKIRVFNIQFNKKLWNNTIRRAFYLYYSLQDNKPPRPEPSILCRYCPWKWRCYSKDKRKEEVIGR